MAKKKLLASSAYFEVSQSKVGTWRECQRMYQYQYEENLRKKKLPRPLKFGGIIHKMVEADAQEKDPSKVLKKVARENKQLFLEEREMYGDIVNDIEYVMGAYFDYWADDPITYLRREGRTAEHPFKVEIDHGIVCKGTIDGVALDKKLKWLVEHKSHKIFPDEDHRWRNLQSAVYIRICEMLDWWQLDGTLWDYIRSKPPTKPHINKDGTMSKAKIDTLPDVIIDFCEENKIKPPKEMLDESIARLPEWFQRIKTPVKPKVVDFLFNDFVTTAKLMADTPLPKRGRPMTIGQHCDWCQFEPLCRAQMQGLDVAYVKKQEYEESDYD